MRAKPGDIDRAQFILSCMDIFSLSGMPQMRLLALYHRSISKGYTTTAHIFMAPSPKKIPYGEYDFVEGRDMDYLTLGEKRSLARPIRRTDWIGSYMTRTPWWSGISSKTRR